MAIEETKQILVVMSTYNGERYLSEQIQSISLYSLALAYGRPIMNRI